MSKNFKPLKRGAAVLLAAAVMFSALFLGACGGRNKDYPVTVGEIQLEEAPKNVVVLNANVLDIMMNLGYAGVLVGKSDECTQSSIDFIPAMGPSASPDINAIKAAGTDTVLADETLDEACRTSLSEAGINVFRLNTPKTESELGSLYQTIGTILAGKVSGAQKAAAEYASLYENLSRAALVSKTSLSYTVCYLYIDENGSLAVPSKDSFIDRLICATGSSTVCAEDVSEGSTVEETLLKYNPAFIFYDSEDILTSLKSNAETAKLHAIVHNQCFEMPYDTLNLMGISASLNASALVEILYPQNNGEVSAPTQPEENTVTEENSEAEETEVTEETEETEVTEETDESENNSDEPKDLSSEYGITFDEDTVIDANSDKELIIALQQRLIDLGYLDGTADGTFGEVTKQCIKNFQYTNNYDADGIADYGLLSVLFSSEAKER